MMEINPIHDIYQRLPVTTSNVFALTTDENVSSPKGITEVDTLKISSKGTFQIKLDAETKRYVATAKHNDRAASGRIEAAKIAYQGDHCPVNGSDIAGAILKKICGY